MSTEMIPGFLNVNEAAEFIGCSTGRVRQLLIAGEIQGKKANARAWLVPLEEAQKVKSNEASTGRPRKSKK